MHHSPCSACGLLRRSTARHRQTRVRPPTPRDCNHQFWKQPVTNVTDIYVRNAKEKTITRWAPRLRSDSRHRSGLGRARASSSCSKRQLRGKSKNVGIPISVDVTARLRAQALDLALRSGAQLRMPLCTPLHDADLLPSLAPVLSARFSCPPASTPEPSPLARPPFSQAQRHTIYAHPDPSLSSLVCRHGDPPMHTISAAGIVW